MALFIHIHKTIQSYMRMIFSVLLLCYTIVQVNTISENIFCSFSSSDEVMIQNIPTIFELNVPYTGR
jgi:hypothetical protein